MKPPKGPEDDALLGQAGEDLAAGFLQKHGYQILQRNYSYPGGEIDIIAADGEILAIVEVKTRSDTRHGPPELAVDRRKQRLIQRAAQRFIIQNRLRRPQVRYDIVTVILRGTEGKPELRLFKNAF